MLKTFFPRAGFSWSLGFHGRSLLSRSLHDARGDHESSGGNAWCLVFVKVVVWWGVGTLRDLRNTNAARCLVM